MRRSTTRLQPFRALRALGRALVDPEDTAQVGVILEALGGRSLERNLERLRRRPDGEAMLRRQPSLFEVLSELEALRRLPEDSLGHAYAHYVEREHLDLDALAALRATTPPESDPAAILEASLRDRTIAMHDLLHVLTGYGRDLVGEASLNAFAWAQTGNPATAFIWAATWLLSLVPVPRFLREGCGLSIPPDLEAPAARAALRAEMRHGYRLGCEADWLFGADWEALLDQPIDAVRRRYGITPARYAAIRPLEAPDPVAA